MSKEPKIPQQWSDAEKWVWQEIKAGRIADFQLRYNENLDVQKPDGWEDSKNDRQLTSSFLLSILTENDFRFATPYKGVRINQASFKDEINLEHASIDCQLWLENCRFEGELNLKNLHVKGWFSLEGSWFKESINLIGSFFDIHVSLMKVKMLSQVDLTSAKIGGQIDMSTSSFEEKLIMNEIEVTQSLIMRDKAKFGDVDMIAARIDGQIDMRGINVKGMLNMNSVVIGQSLIMRDQANFKEVDLIAVKVGTFIDMRGSRFEGMLNMNSAVIGNSLFMRDQSSFNNVDLISAKVGNQMDVSGSEFGGKLSMDAIEIGQHMFMRDKASFNEVTLTSAKIEGQISMGEGNFKGDLNMGAIEVGQHLLMGDKSNFKGVNITSAKIGGQISMIECKFDGQLNMEGIEVGQSVFMRSSNFSGNDEVIIHFARIGSDLDLSGATISALDLTATTIKSEIRLGSASHQPTNWVGNSKMTLRNTTVGAIQDAYDTENSWPKNLELGGFEYGRLGGFGADGTADMLNRSSKWFIKWLERDKSFSPQPYEILAKNLRESGYPSKANAIQFAARKRSRQEAWSTHEGKSRESLRWIGLTLLQYTIGYGLGARYFRVLWWFGGFTLIGFFVLMASMNDPSIDYFKMIWASFDQVLPIVTLNKAHDSLILGSGIKWVISYFYFQKIVGYILGGFLGAGLAGLTQKN